ncbi:5-hydroxytryptamine receptor 3E-like [Megaptera novaeangliae]
MVLAKQHGIINITGYPQAPALGPLSYREHKSSLPILTHSVLTTGRSRTCIIDCSGFGQHGVYTTALDSVFGRKAFRPVTNFSIPTLVNISFTMSAILDVDEQLQLLSFLWLETLCILCLHLQSEWILNKDIMIMTLYKWESRGIKVYEEMDIRNFKSTSYSMDVDKTPKGLQAYINNEGHIRYKKPTNVVSICSLDIFYFPFDQQNCTLTFSSFLCTVENMLLGMEKEVWEIADTSQDMVQTHGEWELLGINKATPKMSVGTNLYDQIIFYDTQAASPRFHHVPKAPHFRRPGLPAAATASFPIWCRASQDSGLAAYILQAYSTLECSWFHLYFQSD